jgi:biopolymer transport protein ExbB/TolQ
MSVARSHTSQLSWTKSDIEQRLFFSGGRFTQINTLLSLLLAIAFTAAICGALAMTGENVVRSKLIGQGPIPYSIVFMTCWCLVILGVKQLKLNLQRRCLKMMLTPQDDPAFVLSPGTVRQVTDKMFLLVDKPEKFLLFNRIQIALSNLANLGRVSDVDDILRSQADTDEATVETSYILLSGLIWAIPILGFVGTVLGLSVAIGNFGGAMAGGTDEILPELQKVTGGLGLAFDTTLEALIAALGVQLLTTFVRKSEHEFLADCSEYCTNQIVNRLRLLPYETGSPE